MKKILYVMVGLLAGQAFGADKELEKRKLEAVQSFITANRESDGNYTTISLRNWQRKVGIPFMSTDELIRKVLYVFGEHYKNLEVVDYVVTYTNKVGPGAGIEYDFLIIQHETKPARTLRFATKKVGEPVAVAEK